MAKFGAFVSNENKSVLSTIPSDLSFSSDFDMYKIQQELLTQNGETVNKDHGLNYFPFFLAWRYGPTDSISISDNRIYAFYGHAYVTVWDFQTKAYIFIAFNPGAS